MPEKQHRNPFEKHINSELFDVSQLGDRLPMSEMDMLLSAFFDALPEDLSEAMWNKALTEDQQNICIHLTAHLIQRIKSQPEYPEWIDTVPEDELRRFLLIPLSIGMLAENHLREDDEPEPAPPAPVTHTTYEQGYADLPADWGMMLNERFLRAKDFIISLFRRN